MSYERLNVKEILEQDPWLKELSDSEQAKLNHKGCTAGRDTKKRLFVKRDGNAWVAYCHHCEGRGAYRHGLRSHIRKRKNDVTYDVRLPSDLTIPLSNCHPKMNVWLGQYGITMEERLQHEIGWSESRHRCILPIRMHGKLVAFQERRLLEGDCGPKYLTTRRPDVKHPIFETGVSTHGGTLVVTEDILSAIKVGRVANTTAILGTYLPDEQLGYVLRRKPERILIWLDDDNPTVRKQQRRLLRRFGAFVDTHRIIGHTRDPKALDVDEIREVVYGCNHAVS